MLVRVEEHEDDHHAVVGSPPDDERRHNHHADAEGLDLRPVNQPPSVDVVLPDRVLGSFLLESPITI